MTSLRFCLVLAVCFMIMIGPAPADAGSARNYCLSLQKIKPQMDRYQRQIKAAGGNTKRICRLTRRALRIIRRGDKIFHSKRCAKLVASSTTIDAKRKWNWAKAVYRENYRVIHNAYRKHCR